jgi:hypothetical protein
MEVALLQCLEVAVLNRIEICEYLVIIVRFGRIPRVIMPARESSSRSASIEAAVLQSARVMNLLWPKVSAT